MKPDIHTLSDSLLWKRFLEGDSSAYTQIYNRTVQDLFRFGLLYTSDKELIKDCIHDVFVKIHVNRAKLAPTDNIAAYLTVALKNTLFNALKKTTDSLSFDEIGEREETVDESPSTPETIYINGNYTLFTLILKKFTFMIITFKLFVIFAPNIQIRLDFSNHCNDIK